MAVMNPAEALLTLLSGWRNERQTTPESLRRAGSVNQWGFWQVQNRAVALLVECDALLDEMAVIDPDFDIEVHRADLLQAYQAVYGYAPRWSTNATAVFDDTVALRRLAGTFRLHLRGSATGVDRTVLEQALTEALDEVGQATYLSVEARGYLVSLLRRALGVVRDEAATESAVRAVAHQAAGAIVDVSVHAPEEKRSWFRTKADVIATTILTSSTTFGVTQGIQAGGKAIAGLIGAGE